MLRKTIGPRLAIFIAPICAKTDTAAILNYMVDAIVRLNVVTTMSCNITAMLVRLAVDEYHRRTMGQYKKRTMGQYVRLTVGQHHRRTMGQYHRRNTGQYQQRTMGQYHRQTMGQYQ